MRPFGGLLAFGRSVLVGASIASIIPAAIFTVTFGGFTRDSISLFGVVLLYAGLIALFVTITGAIVVGLLSTLILRRLNRESEIAYMITGGIGGFLLPLLTSMILQVSGLWGFAVIMGPIAGAVVGRTWWRSYRQNVAALDSP